MRRPGTALLALALGLAPSVALAGSAHVRLTDDLFSPARVSVPIGATVTWTNGGRNPHTVTSDEDGVFDSGDMERDGRFSVTFDEPGRYPYFCAYHGSPGGLGMAGEVLVGVSAAGQDENEPVPPPEGPGRTLRVPEDHGDIQGAVNAARPGDLVLIAPGRYTEGVRVKTPYITIRGLDRNRVVLDGEHRIPNGVQVLEADGVVVENLTVRRFTLNGVYWARVSGFRGSHVSAIANGSYGLYAIDSRYGLIERSYAAGHPDSGFYIGQCHPCDTVITDVLAERNGVGYSGTNAGGNLHVLRSEWRDNQAGIVPNSLDAELYPPQRDTTIAGNWVHGNSNRDAPARRFAYPAFGNGIFVTGGRENVVRDNLVEDHETFGIVVVMSIDRNYWLTGANEVRGNVVRGSGVADLALGAGATGGDCFAGNDFRRSLPPAIELLHGCGFSPAAGAGGDPGVLAAIAGRFAAGEGFPHGDWRSYPAAGPAQPSMPDAASAPPRPAVDLPGEPPAAPLPAGDGNAPGIEPRLTVLGVAPLAAPSVWGVLISSYAYLLPLALYAAWFAVAFWDLARREDLGTRRRLAWAATVLLVPLLGPVLYFALARSPIPGSLRIALVAGGMGAYALFAALAYRLAGA